MSEKKELYKNKIGGANIDISAVESGTNQWLQTCESEKRTFYKKIVITMSIENFTGKYSQGEKYIEGISSDILKAIEYYVIYSAKKGEESTIEDCF